MSTAPETFYFIPHTHWEGAVFQTREAYLEMGLPNILRALRLLKAYPDYRFTLDQVCYVAPFLQRYPEETAAFRQFVQEGRLAIVGGTDVMLDVNMPSGESFVRQVLYGKGYFRNALGVEVTVGWQLDTFGHHAQMPQLLKLAGFTSFWFARGVSDWSVPAEFHWEGLDGSRIPAFWLSHGSYALLYGSPRTLPEFTEFVTQRYGWLTPIARGHTRVAVSGADVSEPEAHVPELVAQFNQQPDMPFRLQLAVPADYEAAVAARADLPVITGELNPIFQGIYSSRIELKQRTRELETLLTTAESLGALLATLGVPTEQADVWRAWEPMLFNQAHDLMSGVMTDHVYEDSLRGFDFSTRLAEELVQERLQGIIDNIDTRGAGIPLVVFNTLGWSRSDVVITRISFTDPAISAVTLLDSDGQAVPCQLLDVHYFADGGILQADLVFVAHEIPAMGYAVYQVLPGTTSTAAQIAVAQEASVLENEYYRVEVARANGAITTLHVKDGNWDALNGPANVVAMESDHGDFWELYHPLDGGSAIAMTSRHDPPQPGTATFSTEQTATPGTVTRGPVFAEYTVSHPLGDGEFRTTIRLYHGLRRLEIRTTIVNRNERVRYRVLFPTPLRHATNTHEIPFGAITRPEGIEFPAQNWVDCSDGSRGVALLNRGLPGNNIAEGTLMLSLLRSTSIVAYGYGGGYEPGMGSDSGLELGQERTFDYGLLPHAGDWRQAEVYREGQAFNHPLLAHTATAHAGQLPPRWGYLSVSPANLVVSSLKVSENGQRIVLRLYEAAGIAIDDVTLTFAGTLTAAEELNLLEDPIQPLPVDGSQLHTALQPFEIKTFGLQVDVMH